MGDCAEVLQVNSTTDLIKNNIKVALRSSGVTDEVKSIDLVLPPELRGEHFATETAYAKIHFTKTSLPPKNLFVKKFSSSVVQREMVKNMKVMDKEAAFFNKVLPALRQFSKRFPGCEDLLNFFPKCLYADEDCVILENLVLDYGYIMLDKEEQQDYEAAKLVFTHLARFHAVNYAFIETMGRDQFLREFELSVTESFDFSSTSFMAPMFDNGLATCIKILQDNPMEGSKETIEKLGKMIGHTLPVLASTLERDNNHKLLVLNHGDCWNNNMLFKKDPETGRISDHLLVDFQITRYGSPCLDLGYYFLTSVKSEVRRAHFEDLLKLYLDEFEATATRLGKNCPSTFEELLVDFKHFSKLGHYVALSMISAIGAFKNLEMDELGTDPDPVKMMETFNKIIADWIAANPDKANTSASGIIQSVKDFDEIQRK